MKYDKNIIINLHKEGKTYDEIVVITGASKGTISYYCGDGQKEKTLLRQKQRRKLNVIAKKADYFKNRKSSKGFENKIENFRTGNRDTSRTLDFTWEDVYNKISSNPYCYLTGIKIDINNPKEYSLDHILPISRGGDNSLENMGLTSKQINIAKSNLTPEEFINLCKTVLEYNGYTVNKMAPA